MCVTLFVFKLQYSLLSLRYILRIIQQYTFIFKYQEFEEGWDPTKTVIGLHKMCSSHIYKL